MSQQEGTGHKRTLVESRIILAALTLCWSIATAGLLINAIVKTDNMRNKIIALIPPPTVVAVSVAAVRIPAIFATVPVFFIMIIAFAALFRAVFSKKDKDYTPEGGFGCLLVFFLLWLLGDLVAMTYRYATRDIQITAWVDGVQVPDDVVNNIKNSIGFVWRYKHMGIWLVAIIFSWICWGFAALLTGVLFAAAASGPRTPTNRNRGVRSDATFKEAPREYTGPIENIAPARSDPVTTVPETVPGLGAGGRDVPVSGDVDVPVEASQRSQAGDATSNV